MGAGGPGTRHRGRISDAHSHAACDQIATAEGRRAWASPRANPASGIAPFPGPAAEPSVTMAQHWRGAEPRWSLGGAVLGVCLAGVAGQLVEVRQGGAEGLGVAVKPSRWRVTGPLSAG